MNNGLRWKRLKHAKRRARNELKRRRKKKTYKGKGAVYHKMQSDRIFVDKRILQKFQSPFCLLLSEHGLFAKANGKVDNRVRIPKVFSLVVEYEAALKCIQHSMLCIQQNLGGEIIYDFSKCKEVDQSALFLLQIIRMEINSELKKVDVRLSVLSAKPKLTTIKSGIESVDRHLVLCGFLDSRQFGKAEGMQPIHSIGYVKGSKAQAHYLENQKGIITTGVRRYVNTCLGYHGLEMTATGINHLDGLVSEILNNAEDHSPTNTYYLTANFSRELPSEQQDDRESVGMLNLSILNIGYSIARGFEETKDANAETYNALIQGFNRHKSIPGCTFTQENMFTLYALQDGVSRLKFEDESRGTGTMKFINSFFAIGDYEDIGKDYRPQLCIYSGHTILVCDNRFRPVEKGTAFIMPLNEEQDLAKLPCPKHLRALPKKFPGTLLSASFYLNEKHLTKKIKSNAHNHE